MQRFLPAVLVMLLCTTHAGAAPGAESQPPPIVQKWNEHPVGYSLIGIGSVVSFLSFGGLFAGGIHPAYCDDSDRRKGGESREECRDRISDENDEFYRTMGIGLGVGAATVATGLGLVLWEGDDKDSPKVNLRLFEQGSSVEVVWNLP